MVRDLPVKIGAPYQVGGRTYAPEDVAAYDEVGYASWYGRELEGKSTANGEAFLPSGVSGAHKTLPLPTYVEVTALDTGKTILVRINDRGPFANDRLIDLSEGAARQLGIMGQGAVGVRVRKVNPIEQERAVLRAGQAAAQRIETPESLLRVLRSKLAALPRPVDAAPATVMRRPGADGTRSSGREGRFIVEGKSDHGAAPLRRKVASGVAPGDRDIASEPGYVVQVAAFSSRQRADDLARRIDADVSPGRNGLFRVRYGPFMNEQAAQSGLEKARKHGYSGAMIYRD